MVEHRSHTPSVAGSNPAHITKYTSVAQLEEHNATNVKVRGSSPFGSTNIENIEKGFVVESGNPETPKHPKPKGEYAVRSLIILLPNFIAHVAQLVEQLVEAQRVGGSNPSVCTILL